MPVGPVITGEFRSNMKFHGKQFRVADLSQLPWPRAAGGHRRTWCALEEVVKRTQHLSQREPSEHEVTEFLESHWNNVWKSCSYHTPLSLDELVYAADLATWFVERGEHDATVIPDQIAVRVVVARDGHPPSRAEPIVAFVDSLFAEPMTWSFIPEDPLMNGNHRLCVMKGAGIPRSPMAVLDQT